MRLGQRMEVWGEGFVHPTPSCLAAAQGRVAPEAVAETLARPTAMAAHLQKQVKVAERFADRRMAQVRACMDGLCGLGRTAPGADCLGGCGRRLHTACSDVSGGHMLKGNFTCHACRLAVMGAEGAPHEALLNEVCQQVVLDLTLGRESTNATHLSFVRLTEKWVAEKKAQGLTRVLSPTENLECFRQFARWMVVNTDRERSFRSTMRAAAGYFEAARKTNFTKDPRVKALFRELDDLIGTEPQPMTHGTRRMLVQGLRFIAEKYAKKPYLRAREAVSIINESVGCLRATESCAAVEKHGLAANDCFLLQDMHSGEVSVELKVHDSKTGFPRWVNMAGETTTSRVQVAEEYMNLFKTNGLKLASGEEGGFTYIQPDSWSVKLSLLGVPSDYLVRMERALSAYGTADPGMTPRKDRYLKYAKDAKEATTGGAAHKYVLLNEGPRDWAGHAALMACLEREGLGTVNQDINLVPAPLLRATHRTGALLMPMPLTYDSAYATQKAIFAEAFKRANPAGDKDPEFDLQGHETAHWGQHSWRRLGDKVARDDKVRLANLGVSDTEIDLFCGWDQYEHSKDMQLHYAGQQRSYRVKRCAITQSM